MLCHALRCNVLLLRGFKISLYSSVCSDEINIIRKKSVVLSAVAALEYTAVPLAMLARCQSQL